jgi:hypothetical protein
LITQCEDISQELKEFQEKHAAAVELNEQCAAKLEAAEKANNKLRSRVEKSVSQYEEIAVSHRLHCNWWTCAMFCFCYGYIYVI